ncbi:MAG: HD domain-containing protein [Elusimicrobia bacterium]|nr:HD domain-containing protein [Elusimicrobiota bacterium]
MVELFHDVGKPATAKKEGGEWHFYGHDAVGARIVAALSKRLRLSSEEGRSLSRQVGAHAPRQPGPSAGVDRPGGLPFLSGSGRIRRRPSHRFPGRPFHLPVAAGAVVPKRPGLENHPQNAGRVFPAPRQGGAAPPVGRAH